MVYYGLLWFVIIMVSSSMVTDYAITFHFRDGFLDVYGIVDLLGEGEGVTQLALREPHRPGKFKLSRIFSDI